MVAIAQRRKTIEATPFAIQSLREKIFFIWSNDKGEAAGTHPKIRQSYSRSPRPAG